VNCGLKAFRRQVTAEVPLTESSIASSRRGAGVRVTGAVAHRPRAFGRSSYGWSRALRGAMDMITVICLTRYNRRPAHFFSLPGAALIMIGGVLCSYIAGLRVVYGDIQSRHPLLIFAVLLVVVGVQLFTTGLVGEMLVDASRRVDDDYHRARKIG
jgi:dolichol-phosphate mannosyltransferase